MSSPNLLPASCLSRQIFHLSPNLVSPPPPLPPDSVYTSCYCEENIYLLAQIFLAEAVAHASRGLAWPWEAYVVFISNRGKTVALWSQKLRAPDVVVWDYHVVLVLRPATRVPGIQDRDILCGEPADRELKTCVKHTAPSPHVRPRVAIAQAPMTQLGVENSDSEPWATRTMVDDSENVNISAWVYDFDTTLAVPCLWRDYLGGTFPYALDDALKVRIDDRLHSLFRVIPANVYVDNFASDRSHMIVRAPRSEARVANSSAAGAIPHLATASPSNGAPNTKLDGGQEDGGPDTEAIVSSVIQYSSPPPPYPPLRGAKAREQGVVHNLMESFVAMEPNPMESSRAAEGDEDLPERGLRTSSEVESPDDAGNAATARTRGGDRSARAGVQYGQVMDVGAFVRWLSAADDTSAPR